MGLELVCSRGASDDGDPGNSPVRRVNEQTARRATGVSGRGKSCPTFAGASAMSSTAWAPISASSPGRAPATGRPLSSASATATASTPSSTRARARASASISASPSSARAAGSASGTTRAPRPSRLSTDLPARRRLRPARV